MDYNISSSAFDNVMPAPLTNEVPHLSIWNILNRQNQNDWAKDYYGRTITQYGDFDSIKVIGNVRSNNYQSDAITFISTDGEKVTGYIPKINFMVDGGFEIEADYFMHELVKQLGRLYPEHPNAIFNLTPSERKSYWNQASHMINSFFDLDNIAYDGEVEEFYLKTKFLENITAVRKYCGLPEEESMLTRLVGIPSVFTGAAEYVDNLGNKIITYEEATEITTELHNAYSYSSIDSVSIVGAEEVAARLSDNFSNFNGLSETVEKLSGISNLAAYAYADTNEFVDYVITLTNNILKYGKQVAVADETPRPLNTSDDLGTIIANKSLNHLIATYNPLNYPGSFSDENYSVVLGKDTVNGFLVYKVGEERFDTELLKGLEGKILFKQTPYTKAKENNIIKLGAVRYNETFLRNYTQACLHIYNVALGPNTVMRNKVSSILTDSTNAVDFYVQFKMKDSDGRLVCSSILNPELFKKDENQSEGDLYWTKIGNSVSMLGIKADISPEKYWIAVENTANVENISFEAGTYSIEVTLNILQTPYGSLEDFRREITIAYANVVSNEVVEEIGEPGTDGYSITTHSEYTNYDPPTTSKGILILPANWEKDESWFEEHPGLMTTGTTLIATNASVETSSLFNTNVLEVELEKVTSVYDLVSTNASILNESVTWGEKQVYYVYAKYDKHLGDIIVNGENPTKEQTLKLMSSGVIAEPKPVFKTSGRIVDATTIAIQDSVEHIIEKNKHSKCMIVDALGNHYYGEVIDAVTKNTECFITVSSIYPDLKLDIDDLKVIVCIETVDDYISQIPDVESIIPAARGYTARAANYKGRYFYAVDWKTLSDANLIYYLSNIYSDTTAAYTNAGFLSETGVKDPEALTRVEGITVVECTDEQLPAVEAILEENKSLYIDSSMKRLKHVPILADTTAYCAESGSLANSVSNKLPATLIMYEGLDPEVNGLGDLIENLKDVDVRDIEFVTDLVGRSLIVWGDAIWDNNQNSDLAQFRSIWSNYFASFEVKNLDKYFPTNNTGDQTLNGTRFHTVSLDNYNYSYNDGNPAGKYNIVFSPTEEMVNHPPAVITDIRFVPADVLATGEAKTYTGPSALMVGPNKTPHVDPEYHYAKQADSDIGQLAMYEYNVTFSPYNSDNVDVLKMDFAPAGEDEIIEFDNNVIKWTAGDVVRDVKLENLTFHSFGKFFQLDESSGKYKFIIENADNMAFGTAPKLFEYYIASIMRGINEADDLTVTASVEQVVAKLKERAGTGPADELDSYLVLVDTNPVRLFAGESLATPRLYLIRFTYDLDSDTIIARMMVANYHPSLLKMLFTTNNQIPMDTKEVVSQNDNTKFMNALVSLNSELLVCVPANEYTIRFLQSNIITKSVDRNKLDDSSLIEHLNNAGGWALTSRDVVEEDATRPPLLLKESLTLGREDEAAANLSVEAPTVDGVKVYSDNDHLIHYERGGQEMQVEIGTSFKFFSDYTNIIMNLSLDEGSGNTSNQDSIITFDKPVSDKQYMFLWDIRPVAERVAYTDAGEIQVVDRKCTLEKLPVLGRSGNDLVVSMHPRLDSNVDQVVADVTPIDGLQLEHDLSNAEITVGKYFKSNNLPGIDYTYYKRKFVTSGTVSGDNSNTVLLADETFEAVEHVAPGDKLHLIFFDNLAADNGVVDYTFQLPDGEEFEAITGSDDMLPLEQVNWKFLGMSGLNLETSESGESTTSFSALVGLSDSFLEISFNGFTKDVGYNRIYLCSNTISAPLSWFTIGNTIYAASGSSIYKYANGSLESVSEALNVSVGSGDDATTVTNIVALDSFIAGYNGGDKQYYKWGTHSVRPDWLTDDSGAEDFRDFVELPGEVNEVVELSSKPQVANDVVTTGTEDIAVIKQYLESRFTSLVGDKLVLIEPVVDETDTPEPDAETSGTEGLAAAVEKLYWDKWFKPKDGKSASGLTVDEAIEGGFVYLPNFLTIPTDEVDYYECTANCSVGGVAYEKGKKIEVEEYEALSDTAKTELATKGLSTKYKPLRNDAGEIIYELSSGTKVLTTDGTATIDISAVATRLLSANTMHSGSIVVSEALCNGQYIVRLNREAASISVFDINNKLSHKFNLGRYLGIFNPIGMIDMSKPHTVPTVIYETEPWELLENYKAFLKDNKTVITRYIKANNPDLTSIAIPTDEQIDEYASKSNSYALRVPAMHLSYERSVPYSLYNYLMALRTSICSQATAATASVAALNNIPTYGRQLFGNQFPGELTEGDLLQLSKEANELTSFTDTDINNLSWNKKIDEGLTVEAKGDMPVAVTSSWEKLSGENDNTVPSIPDSYTYGRISIGKSEDVPVGSIQETSISTKGVVGEGVLKATWGCWKNYMNAGQLSANAYTKITAYNTVKAALNDYRGDARSNEEKKAVDNFLANITSANSNLVAANNWAVSADAAYYEYVNALNDYNAKYAAHANASDAASKYVNSTEFSSGQTKWNAWVAAVNEAKGGWYTYAEFKSFMLGRGFSVADIDNVWNWGWCYTSHTDIVETKKWFQFWKWFSEAKVVGANCTDARIYMAGSSGSKDSGHGYCNTGRHTSKGAANVDGGNNPFYAATKGAVDKKSKALNEVRDTAYSAKEAASNTLATKTSNLTAQWSVGGLDYSNKNLAATKPSPFKTSTGYWKTYVAAKNAAQTLADKYFQFRNTYLGKDANGKVVSKTLNTSATNNNVSFSVSASQTYYTYSLSQSKTANTASRTLTVNVAHNMGSGWTVNGRPYVYITDNGANVSYTSHLNVGLKTFNTIWLEGIASQVASLDSDVASYQGDYNRKLAATKTARGAFETQLASYNTLNTNFRTQLGVVVGKAGSDYRVPGIGTETGQWTSDSISSDFDGAVSVVEDGYVLNVEAALAIWNSKLKNNTDSATGKTNEQLINEGVAYMLYYVSLFSEFEDYFPSRSLDYDSIDADWSESLKKAFSTELGNSEVAAAQKEKLEELANHSFIDLPARFEDATESMHIAMSNESDSSSYLYVYGNIKNYNKDENPAESGLSERFKNYINQTETTGFTSGENWNSEYIPYMFRYDLVAKSLELVRFAYLPDNTRLLGMYVKNSIMYLQWAVQANGVDQYVTTQAVEGEIASISLPSDLNAAKVVAGEAAGDISNPAYISALDNSIGLWLAEAADEITIDAAYKADGLKVDSSKLNLPTIYSGTVRVGGTGSITVSVPSMRFTGEHDCLIYVEDPSLQQDQTFYGEDITANKASIPESFSVFRVSSSKFADYASLVNRFQPTTTSVDGSTVVNYVGDVYPKPSDLLVPDGNQMVDSEYKSKFYKLNDDGSLKTLKNKYGEPVLLVMDFDSVPDIDGYTHIVKSGVTALSTDGVLNTLNYPVAVMNGITTEPESYLVGSGITAVSGIQLPELVNDAAYVVNNTPISTMFLQTSGSSVVSAMRVSEVGESLLLSVSNESALNTVIQSAGELSGDASLPRDSGTITSFELDDDENVKDPYVLSSFRAAGLLGLSSGIFGFKFVIESLEFKVMNRTNSYPVLRPITAYQVDTSIVNNSKVVNITSPVYGADGIVLPKKGYGQAFNKEYEYPGMWTQEVEEVTLMEPDTDIDPTGNPVPKIHKVKKLQTLTFGTVDVYSDVTALENPFFERGKLVSGELDNVLTLCDPDTKLPMKTLRVDSGEQPNQALAEKLGTSYYLDVGENTDTTSYEQDITFEKFTIKYNSFAEADVLPKELPDFTSNLQVLNTYIDMKQYTFDDARTLRVAGSINYIKFNLAEDVVYDKFFAKKLKLSAKMLVNNPTIVKNSNNVINMQDLYNQEVAKVSPKAGGTYSELALQSNFQDLFGYTRVCTIGEELGIEGNWEAGYLQRLANGVRYMQNDRNRFIKSDYRPDYNTLACNPAGKLIYFDNGELKVDSTAEGNKEYFPGCETTVQSKLYDLENIFADCKFYKSSGEVVSLFGRDFETTSCIIKKDSNNLIMSTEGNSDYLGFYRLLPTNYTKTYAQSLYGNLTLKEHSVLAKDAKAAGWKSKDTRFEVEFDLGSRIEVSYTSKFAGSNYLVLKDKDNNPIANIYLQKPLTVNDLLVISEC